MEMATVGVMTASSGKSFERWLAAEDVCVELAKVGIDISPKTLGDRARQNKVPSRKLNGKRRYRLSELMDFYEKAER